MSEIEIYNDDVVRIIKINRPQVRNAINGTTARALRKAWLDFDADETVRVGILTGGDTVFCAGADLKEIDSLKDEVEGRYGPLGFTRLFVRKPTLAAVSGYCVAGGLELACWCDLRIADETAVFGCFERRFGVPLIDGGTQRLPRIIGLGRALDMILTGRPVSAREAHSIGLVNEIVPHGQTLSCAVELAKVLAAFPQECLLNDRQAVYEGLDKPMQEALQIEAQLGKLTLESAESRSGPAQFVAGKGRSGKF